MTRTETKTIGSWVQRRCTPSHLANTIHIYSEIRIYSAVFPPQTHQKHFSTWNSVDAITWNRITYMNLKRLERLPHCATKFLQKYGLVLRTWYATDSRILSPYLHHKVLWGPRQRKSAETVYFRTGLCVVSVSISDQFFLFLRSEVFFRHFKRHSRNPEFYTFNINLPFQTHWLSVSENNASCERHFPIDEANTEFRNTYRYCSFVRFDIDRGRSPLSWLSSTSLYIEPRKY